MAKSTRYLVATASILLLTCCREPRSSTGVLAAEANGAGDSLVVSQTDSAGVRMVSISGPVESLPEWSLSETPTTEIRGNAAPFIGLVGEVAFLGVDQLVVEDDRTQELRVFGADGRVLRLLGGKGDGPGEFQRITQLSVTLGDTVYAYDEIHSRMSAFDPDGALTTTIAMPQGFAGPRTFVLNAWALGSNRILRFGNRDPEEPGDPSGPVRLLVRNGVLDVASSNGTVLASPMEIPGGSLIVGERFVSPSPFSNHPIVAANGSRVLSASGRAYEFVIRDTNLRPLMVVRWNGWAQPMTPALIEPLRKGMEASLEPLRSRVPPPVIAGELRLVELFFRPEVLPDTLPALGSAMLDEDGRVWVARYRPVDNLNVAHNGPEVDWHQEDVWHVLDPEGTPVARVRLPPETRLLAVRRDRVIVVTRDNLDAQTVRVFTLNRTAPRTTEE